MPEKPLKAKPAFPDDPDRFKDDRDPPVREKERVEIAKQISSLTQFPDDPEHQKRLRKIVERLGRSRQSRRLPPFTELLKGKVPVLGLPEFIVRQADFEGPDVQQLITKFRLSYQRVAFLGGDVLRLRPPSMVEFKAMSAEIGDLPIAPNHLVPLGGWTKAIGGPEPTASRPAWRPPGEARIQVAVVDTGLGLRTDEWLRGLANPELDELYPDPGWPNPNWPRLGLAAGHGTFVAGIVQRVEPSTDIRIYRALDLDGVADDVTVGLKILQAAWDGARIINLSLGTLTVDDKEPPGVQAGIERAREINPNILIVCSAGNYGDTRRVWPAAFSKTISNVVAVAGLNAQGERPVPDWSTHGDFVRFSTIGEGVASTYVRGEEDPLVDSSPDQFDLNDWAIWSGTSVAAPQITGAVASICLTTGLAPTKAAEELMRRGTDIPDYGYAVEILPGT